MFQKVLAFVREKPRVIFLVSALVVQGLEQLGVQVDSAMLENALDLVTLIALGHVMKKSDTDKIV
ncbi:hypothetical protein [Halobacillus salinus]|uniref:Holin n=1 Tax=Halobacillus salinus TaxID=192814 RepID=A0A4Z0GW20_9BACI|nr:hypothetical protein [Halobacillus salinus]TGB01125.1 hypothetical protein E4663_18410 [Halobacillus salinus]